ncbi:MAG: DNA-protecting protein DprA [Bradyrhizobium sp.]|nr:MAG: DNA-protecting protein DprA [Bradyrhizobium sp.]
MDRCYIIPGPRSFRTLLARYGGARAALAALPELARRGGASRPIRVAAIEEIERELKEARRLGVRFIGSGEPEYPPALRHIDSAPPLLALYGRADALQRPGVAIVGSRNASAAGLAFAERLARGLGAAGYVVVSGLARGVDQRAHVASLASGTIGVLAGGHARPYPPEAAPLLPRIAEIGAVISEAPLEWEARGRDFPRRNRIVSGMSLGVIVVEAARGSGSLITARLAAEQGRLVFAVPGSPLDPRAEGTNDLLREGATLCARIEDALEALESQTARDARARLEEARPATDWPEREDEAQAELDLDPVDRSADRASIPGDRIAALLGPSPISIDELARAAEADVRAVRVALIELELAGRIERSGGDRVALLARAENN